jgi:hypothetical protein
MPHDLAGDLLGFMVISFLQSMVAMRGGFFRRLVLAVFVSVAASAFPVDAQEPIPSDQPSVNVDDQHPGFIIVEVTFDAKGAVKTCRILRSNAPFALESSTIDYIRAHWQSPFFADATATLPIVFEATSSATYWDEDMTPPPNLFPYGDQLQNLTLRVSFGSDGWVSGVKVLQPSTNQLVDRETAIWVKVHWHHAAYANQTLDAPFKFQPPPPAPAPAPPVAKAKPPAPPPEPVAIPAIRAE